MSGLCSKYLAGGVAFGGRGLKTVDYDELLTKAQEHRHAAQEQAEKLQALSKQGHSSREAWFLQLHQGVWQHEWSRLVTEGLRLERQLAQWRVDTLQQELEGVRLDSLQQVLMRKGQEVEWMAEIRAYSVQLRQEMEKFERNEISVLRQLQVVLKSWMNCPEAERGVDQQYVVLQDRCEAVRMQLSKVEADLQDEYLQLWSDLKEFNGVIRNEVSSTTASSVLQEEFPNPISHVLQEECPDHVPCVLQEECPDPVLKASLVAEFRALNQHYRLVLQNIQEKYFKLVSGQPLALLQCNMEGSVLFVYQLMNNIWVSLII